VCRSGGPRHTQPTLSTSDRTAMERSTAAVEPSTAVVTTAVIAAESMAGSSETAGWSAPICIPWAIAVTRPVAITPARPPVITRTPVAVIPRARTDKPAVHEPVWPVIPIRSASVGIVAIISIRANGRRAYRDSHRTNPHAHGNLGIGASSRYSEKQNCQQAHIF
jgi:hypothetical protein